MDLFLLRLQTGKSGVSFTASGANVGLQLFRGPPAPLLLQFSLSITFWKYPLWSVRRETQATVWISQCKQHSRGGGCCMEKPCSALKSLKILIIQSSRKTLLLKHTLLSKELVENTFRTELVHSF